MFTPDNLELPKPKDWDAFENLVWELYRRTWKDPRAQRYGRRGQPQHGVDVYGQPHDLGGAYAGIQCKRYDEGNLTLKVMEGEIAKAAEFEPGIGEFYIATTVSRDTALQDAVRKINQGRAGKFPVGLIFWEDLCAELAHPANRDLLEKYYGELIAKHKWQALELPPHGELPPAQDLKPPGSRLPHDRNPVFTGREQELKAAAQALFYSKQSAAAITQAASIIGYGGMGKTQLAIELCYRYAPYLDGIHWIYADQAQEAEIAACGAEMGIEAPTPHDLVRLTLEAWRQGRRLIVLDNLLAPQDLHRWRADLGGLTLLVTSRAQEWPPDLGVQAQPLDTLPRPQGREFLRKLAPRLQGEADSALDALCERLGDLPLALDLAGRHLLKRKRLKVQAFIQEIEQGQNLLGQRAFAEWAKTNTSGHPASLAETFLLSWQRLEDELAKRTFRMLGYCAPNTPVPFELLWKAAGIEAEAEIEMAVESLAEIGLCRVNESGATVHPLLAEFARLGERQVEEDLQAALVKAIEGWKKKLDDSGYWIGFGTLRPHMAAAISHIEDRENKARLMNNLGFSIRQMGDLAGARPYYEQALAIRREVLGEKHPNTATSLNNLGYLLQAMGNLAGARPYLEQALAIRREALGNKHPDTARSLNNLGGLLQDMGDLAGARPYFEQALAIRREALGEKHPDTALSLNNLGYLLKAMGDLAGAKPYYEQALAINREVLGEKHPDTAASLNNLGGLLQAMGDLAGAKPYYEHALAIRREVLGDQHPDTAQSLNNLGVLHAYLEEWEQAVAYMDQALRILLEVLGGDHPNTAQSLISLVFMSQDMGDQSGAQKYFKQIMEITQGRQYPDWHPFAAFLRQLEEGG